MPNEGFDFYGAMEYGLAVFRMNNERLHMSNGNWTNRLEKIGGATGLAVSALTTTTAISALANYAGFHAAAAVVTGIGAMGLAMVASYLVIPLIVIAVVNSALSSLLRIPKNKEVKSWGKSEDAEVKKLLDEHSAVLKNLPGNLAVSFASDLALITHLAAPSRTSAQLTAMFAKTPSFVSLAVLAVALKFLVLTYGGAALGHVVGQELDKRQPQPPAAING